MWGCKSLAYKYLRQHRAPACHSVVHSEMTTYRSLGDLSEFPPRAPPVGVPLGTGMGVRGDKSFTPVADSAAADRLARPFTTPTHHSLFHATDY